MQCQLFSKGIFNSGLIRFLLAGVINTLFGYAVYAALIYINTPYLVALLVSTILGVIFNFFSFGRIAFQKNCNLRIFIKFLASYALIYAVNSIFLILFMKQFLLSPYISQILCIPVGVVISWILMKYWVYKVKATYE